ncbi:MAG: hydroxylamine reductase [Deltaproteobacteria bacterium]|nr:hydroxylamine reductase [Deltaproteobacteria bacterium]
MFCFQCEQTNKGTGCVDVGICGKDVPTAALQDLLVYLTEGVSMYAHRAREINGAVESEIDVFALEALFTTITNVNFDYSNMKGWIEKAVTMRERARALYEKACNEAGKDPEKLSGPASYEPPSTLGGLVTEGTKVSIEAEQARHGADISSLIQLYIYGLKGAAAYSDHAQRLGKSTVEHYGRYHEALSFLGTGEGFELEALLGRCLQAGEINLEAMELLDAANTGTYGHPTPTEVRIEPVAGKAILISGHDLRDLKDLLEQTEGKGINVYTHGEMLPAHGYPELNKYKHLVGNYGGAWQDQIVEFSKFPGAILMSTNCIQRPKAGYFGRIFSSGMVAWPGVQHMPGRDFTPVIEAALAAEGFAKDGPAKTITVGFGHNAVLNVAGTVVEAVKSGAIRHFFLVGGCDGAKSGRNYYTEFAELVPDDCMLLTLACGKFRFNKKDFGSIGGLPRLLDIGQCNDAYSAIKIATALSEAFECGVNELPLSFNISWFEQKAVSVLLTLLHLGIKDIRLGPSLPAFITPKVLGILVEKFAIAPIGKPEDDLKAMLG